ncbi:unnamed protein product [Rotaria socialis]|uniref:Uncharacterized protein n=1 Tax=Rotaria socialis TaxID=392032 RepID=A0A817XLG3_9BILA|nr:unnamed protein product [Rotaria socialis]CAF3317945.1 unnamed protein product [Rotaria socialis]CAF3369754.1 unnamed protein product [Rotaria socialis]CAF3438779.1 unnamed protein product [Rotaria socialis]CAF4259986.1 unnamed protein product [Rotaria socialis]
MMTTVQNMPDSMELPTLKLPQIRPSSHDSNSMDQPVTAQNVTNSYEQWRANIHRDLEEDLQRQVKQILDETERQERLARLRRQYLRAGQHFSPQQIENNGRQSDPWSEIDRRNQRVLYPLNAKESYGAQNHLPKFNGQKNKFSSGSFNLDSYTNYCLRRRLSSNRNDEQLLEDASVDLQNFHSKRQFQTIIKKDSSFLYGNNLLKSSKSDLISIFDQRSINGETTGTYANKHGVIISLDGPFWPRDFRILHPTPKLLSRELAPTEFYFTVTNSSMPCK